MRVVAVLLQGDTAIVDLKFTQQGSKIPLPGLSSNRARIDTDVDPLALVPVSTHTSGAQQGCCTSATRRRTAERGFFLAACQCARGAPRPPSVALPARLTCSHLMCLSGGALRLFCCCVPQHLLGAKVGETRRFSVTLPKDYQVELWQGMVCDVEVAFKELFAWELPEVRPHSGPAHSCAHSFAAPLRLRACMTKRVERARAAGAPRAPPHLGVLWRMRPTRHTRARAV